MSHSGIRPRLVPPQRKKEFNICFILLVQTTVPRATEPIRHLPLGLNISGSDLRAKARFCACSVVLGYTDN